MDSTVVAPLTAQHPDSTAGLARKRTTALMNALLRLQKFPTRQSSRIAIKAKGRILFIDPYNVVAVRAAGNYVSILPWDSAAHWLRESISVMAEKLNPYGFVRINRSFLVNAAFVEEIRPWSTGEYVLRVKGGKEFTVTRTYRQNLKLLAESWIGTYGFVLG